MPKCIRSISERGVSWCKKTIQKVDLYPVMAGRTDIHLDPDGSIPKNPTDGHRFAEPAGELAPHPNLDVAVALGGICPSCAEAIRQALER